MLSYVKTDVLWPENVTEILSEDFRPEMRAVSSNVFKPSLMGLCVMSLLFGSILSKLGEQKTSVIRQLLWNIDEVIKCMMQIMIK